MIFGDMPDCLVKRNLGKQLLDILYRADDFLRLQSHNVSVEIIYIRGQNTSIYFLGFVCVWSLRHHKQFEAGNVVGKSANFPNHYYIVIILGHNELGMSLQQQELCCFLYAGLDVNILH